MLKDVCIYIVAVLSRLMALSANARHNTLSDQSLQILRQVHNALL